MLEQEQPIQQATEANPLPELPSIDFEGHTLLADAGIKGTLPKLRQVAASFGNDPLTLKLLSAYLGRWYAGRLTGLETIPVLYDTTAEGRPLRRVLAAFEHKFADASDLTLLYLVSLTDQPISMEALKLSFRASLLERWLGRRDDYMRFLAPLSRLNEAHWHWVVENLRRLHLIETEERAGCLYLLAPTAIRQYFSYRLQKKHYDVFLQASADIERLLSYTVVTLPDSATEAEVKAADSIIMPEMLWRKDELDDAVAQLQSLRHSLATLRQHTQRLQQHLDTLHAV